MKSMRVRLLAAILLAMACAGSAHAQAVSGDIEASASQAPDNFARDKNVSVRERPRPEYEAAGIHLGGFMAYPKIELDAEYNDNIYATTNGRVDDLIGRFKPGLLLQSTWSRHSLEAFARASVNRYADHSTEDTTDWALGFNGRLDVLRSDVIDLGAQANRLTEPRTSSSSSAFAAEPVRYDYDPAFIGYTHTFNRLKLSARADWRRYDYDDAPSIFGGIVEEDDRDRTNFYYSGRGDYALSPDTALFVQATGNERNYRLPGTLLTPARDSSGYEVLGGVNFDLTNLVRGEVGAGYLRQNFSSPVYNDVKGFGARARVDWFPSQLTTVSGSVSRSVEDSGLTRSGGYLSTNASVQVDHELLRNLILTGSLSYGNDDYNGIDRTDKRFTAGASATWLINRKVGVNFGYSYFKQTSSGTNAGPAFKVNVASVALVLQY